MKRQVLGIIYLIISILCLIVVIATSIIIMVMPLLLISLFRIAISYNKVITILLLWNGALILTGLMIRKKVKKRW